jgi:uncharacterized protein with GYD domain
MTDFGTFDRPTQRGNDTIDTFFSDVLGIGISADRFFMHAQVVGINLAREGVTIAQVREWQDRLRTMRRMLTRDVEDFVWRYAHSGTTDLVEHPEDAPDVANIVAGDTTIVILRSLGLALCEGLKQHPSWEGVEAIKLLKDHIDHRLEQRPHEEFEIGIVSPHYT